MWNESKNTRPRLSEAAVISSESGHPRATALLGFLNKADGNWQKRASVHAQLLVPIAEELCPLSAPPQNESEVNSGPCSPPEDDDSISFETEVQQRLISGAQRKFDHLSAIRRDLRRVQPPRAVGVKSTLPIFSKRRSVPAAGPEPGPRDPLLHRLISASPPPGAGTASGLKVGLCTKRGGPKKQKQQEPEGSYRAKLVAERMRARLQGDIFVPALAKTRFRLGPSAGLVPSAFLLSSAKARRSKLRMRLRRESTEKEEWSKRKLQQTQEVYRMDQQTPVPFRRGPRTATSLRSSQQPSPRRPALQMG